MFWRTCGNTDTISEVSSPDTLFSWMTIRPEMGFERPASSGSDGGHRKAVVRAGSDHGGSAAGACQCQGAESQKEHFMEYPEIADAITELEKKFNGEGRVLIRPSGTEPLVRVMIEGKDQKVIDEEAKRLAELITRIML